MYGEIAVLAGTAATIGFVHTLLGPDHYLPFIVLSKARQWSRRKTAFITFLCGLGHVLSSIVLGFIGIALGIAVFSLEKIETFRGEIAAWMLIAFGFTYFVWGLHRALRGRRHTHIHLHQDGEAHEHDHNHLGGHTHVTDYRKLTPWVLFTIFVFGPCEPLIPLIMYPAARHSVPGVVAVALIFGLVTISTMMAVVMTSHFGLEKLPMQKLERYSHALAGFAIFASGGAIKLFGL